MKTYAPCYYKDFQCIADKCRHNCCIGWEIDIDDNTYKTYINVEGDFGEQIKKNISHEDSQKHFILDENERCPFLNKKGLCDIIINLGENKLCEICTEHPRFRNYFADRCEIGVGICCEEAARLILTQSGTFFLEIISDDKIPEKSEESEEIFYSFRESLFKILQNREKPLTERISELFSHIGIVYNEFSCKQLYDIFAKCEYMENTMPDLLTKIKQNKISENSVISDYETEFEQLLIYLLFRHLPDGIYEGNINERIMFSILSLQMCEKMLQATKYKKGVLNFNDLIEICRLYSSEIEYSEDNTNMLIELF